MNQNCVRANKNLENKTNIRKLKSFCAKKKNHERFSQFIKISQFPFLKKLFIHSSETQTFFFHHFKHSFFW